MRISKSLLVAAAMLASAGIAQAQENVTQATWIGADGQGGSGIWDKWNTAPNAHNYWAAKNAARVFTVTAGAVLNAGTNGGPLIRTTSTTGLQLGQLVTGAGIPANSYITGITTNTSFTISQNLTANATGAYVASPLVYSGRLSNAATLTFNNTSLLNPTADILVDSDIASTGKSLLFTSSGYRLLPGAFTPGVEPTPNNFRDIDVARTIVPAPYSTAPNGLLDFTSVTLTVAGVAGPIALQPSLTLRNPTGRGRITVTNADTTINLESLVASTLSNPFAGAGNIIKSGGAVLQYQGHRGYMNVGYSTSANPYEYQVVPDVPVSALSKIRNNGTPTRPYDLSPTIVGANYNESRLNGLQGQMRIDSGMLMVSGHINMWHDFGKMVDGTILGPTEIAAQVANIDPTVTGRNREQLIYSLAKRMTGVSSVVLNGSAEISFVNTDASVGVLNLNYLHNLKAGDNNDQFQTTVTTGPDATYRLGIHIDQGFEGSVGIIAGSGKVIKTGAGSLTVLNDARLTGDFIAAGGRTILASGSGLVFANNSSFNIAGIQDSTDAAGIGDAKETDAANGYSRRGADIRYTEAYVPGTPNYTTYRPAAFTDPGTTTITTNSAGQFTSSARSGAEVVLVGDQTVRNFQADFALRARGKTNIGTSTGEIYTAADAVKSAADEFFKSELVIPGTGGGSVLYLNGATLTINQDGGGRDGLYIGSVYGSDLASGAFGGRIIKTGAGTLVFLLENGTYESTEVREGTFIANVQGLGQGDIRVASGATFAILQNNAASLQARIFGGTGTTLKLVASAIIDNGSGAQIEANSLRAPGEVDIITKQEQFFGDILVNDGVNLAFTGGVNDTLVNAASITLNSGSTARESVVHFGDTNQLLRNLTGDQYSRIELGRGDIILEQNRGPNNFLGFITGVGSFIKQGTSAFVLVGTGAGGVKDSYYGATIVRPGGALFAGSANAAPNSSALALVGGGSFSTGGSDQTFGALFGSKSSILDIGAATLTIGETGARFTTLTSELQGSSPLLADYLGTTNLVNPVLNVDTAVATGVNIAGATRIDVTSVVGLANGDILSGTGIAPGTVITGIGAGFVNVSKPLTATAAGTIKAQPTITFTPTSGQLGAFQLTATSSLGIGIGQSIVGTGIADGTYVSSVISNSTFGVIGGSIGTNIIKTTSSATLVIGQMLSGAAATGLQANTFITAITPNTTFVAGVGLVGTRTISTTTTEGLEVGQILNGVGIPTGATIVSKSATEITISANLNATARGVVNAGALIHLSRSLTATPTVGLTVNASALVTLNNALTQALPAQPVNIATVRSFDVTSLGLSAAELNLLYAGGITMPELTSSYLEKVAIGNSIGAYTAPTILSGDRDFTQTMSFDGQLFGSGKLLKAGTETLFLRGVSTGFTGQVQIAGGTLDMSYNSLSNVASITVDAGASLAVTVDDVYVAGPSAVTRTLNTPILGAGNFIKNGVGYLKLDPTLAAGQVSYSGTTFVNNGWLEMKVLSTNGAAVINSFNGSAAHLVLTAPNDVTYSGLVSGTGELVIQAAVGKTLTAGGSLTHTGGTNVLRGTLLAQNGWAGATTGNITVAAGATARLNVETALSATGLFSGAGRIVKEGTASLTLGTATTAFSGTYQSNAGTTILASANLFGGVNPTDLIAAIDLRGTSVLDVTANQTFRNLTGEATSQISYGVNGIVITLPIDTGDNDSFAGRFTRGAGVTDASIVKTGLGTLDLSPASGNNELTLIRVESGRLVGTADGYLGANIQVGAGAEVAFNAPSAVLPFVFANNIEGIGAAAGTGSVVKVGLGEAILGSVNLTANTPDFKVEQGILTLTDNRAGVLPMLTANVSAGATFRVKLANARTLGSEITGTGILDLQASLAGVKLVTVTSQPTVTTTNIGNNVRLDVSGINAITGITADTGSFLQIGALGVGRSLTLTQATDGVFNGTIEGTANFTVKGAGLFRYANSLQATTVGTVTVDGGFLGVNVDNTKAITLATATTGTTKLGVYVAPAGNSIYNGTLTGAAGAAQLVKLGGGTLNLTSGVTSLLKSDIFAAYEVREGTLAVTLEPDLANPTGPGIILPNSANVGRAVTLSGGTLALTVGATGGTLLSGAGSTNTGNLNITTANVGDASLLNVLGNVSGNVSVAGGTVLKLGSSGAALLTIAGDLGVSAGSKLTGSAIVGGNLTVAAGSTLAPGYSPGTFNVTGNFTLAGTANMEVSGNTLGGLSNDSVTFSGTADLSGGSVLVQRWNDGTLPAVAPAFGQRFVLFKGTATPAVGANLVSTYFTGLTLASITTDDSTGRYLVVAPAAVDAGAVASGYDGLIHNADGLVHKANEAAVYAVRDQSAYAVAGLDAGIVSYVQAATKVAAGTVYVPGAVNNAGSVATLDPLGARLMIMTDAQLTPALLSLQPAALAAIPASLALGQRAESGALLRRLEMRRYDRAGYSVYYNEGFALATSSSFKGGSGSGATPFDSTVTGAMGGLIKDLNPWSVAGFSAGYTKSKSDLTAGGASAGSVSGNAYRLTGFFSSMLGDKKDSVFVDAGVSVGTSTNKSSRTTFLGTETASPKANSYGAFARFGAGYATKAGVSFSPYVGLDMAKVSGSAFDEAGDATKLKVSSYSYTSARATVGTGMSWLSVGDGETLKFSIDFEAFSELGGGKSTDISASLGGIEFTSSANVSAGSGFRIAPSFTYGPNPDSAYYLTLSLEKAGATQTTGFELGYRRRF